MARTLLDLSKSLEAKSKAISVSASELSKKVAITVLTDLVYKTPVDTSKALSNWVLTLKSKNKTSIPAHFRGKGGSSQTASASEAINLAKAVLKNKKPGESIFITNTLPYIRRLNDGYSLQQPAGFVERAILIGRKIKEKYKLKV